MIDPNADPVWRGFFLYVLAGAICLILQQAVLIPFLPWLTIQPLVVLTVHAGFRRGPFEAGWIATVLGILWDVTGSGLFGACWLRLMLVLLAVHFGRRFLRDTLPFLLFAVVLATVIERAAIVLQYTGFAGLPSGPAGNLSNLPASVFFNLILTVVLSALIEWAFRIRPFRLSEAGISVTGPGGFGRER